MSKSLAILGTASDVGKSLVVAALCRILFRAGVNVAPFKAQNMSLNAGVTADGGEMGRAQILQAQACGLPPHVDMNPILLKPESDQRSQVIVCGVVWGRRDARAYFECHAELFEYVRQSFSRLSAAHDVVVIEGAGSAAELNLRDRDIVNWPVAHMADAGVILVADIDRGGVFAQVIGTLDLLEPRERDRVLGVIINKFRGDRRLFDDGVAILERRTGLPVLGVLPFVRDLMLDQEDGVPAWPVADDSAAFADETVNVAVVLLPRMSNVTDFHALAAEPDVTLRYARTPGDAVGADVMILPGSKHTMDDLRDMRARGFADAVMAQARARRREVVGICGGMQMLGERIEDPHAVESGGAMDGLGLLPVHTTLRSAKHTRLVTARAQLPGLPESTTVRGYEIHAGVTRRRHGAPCFLIDDDGAGNAGADNDVPVDDGAASPDGLVWGTYIHGIFDAPAFRRAWLNRIRARKGLPPRPLADSEATTQRLRSELDRWADHVEQHLDMPAIRRALDVPSA